jgi:hypothetical protein
MYCISNFHVFNSQSFCDTYWAICMQASESIRKVYDRKCHQLRHQFAKDQGTQVIDKTRAVVKDLHSRIRVAIYSVDSISKRIEKMRDEELYPQLLELTEGYAKSS